MRITEKDTKFFINLSNDKNKIHFDKKYAKKFFFKEPIAHGINIINFALAEFIKTKKVGQWKREKPDLHKRPTIFIIHKK